MQCNGENGITLPPGVHAYSAALHRGSEVAVRDPQDLIRTHVGQGLRRCDAIHQTHVDMANGTSRGVSRDVYRYYLRLLGSAIGR
jgi:hypothetical protein